MGNYVADNRNELSDRHYVRRANAGDYWFDFYGSKLASYRRQFGDDFCMVIFGREDVDDAYIMPFRDIAVVFRDDLLDARQRWIGNIKNNVLRLPQNTSISVSRYFNAFELLSR